MLINFCAIQTLLCLALCHGSILVKRETGYSDLSPQEQAWDNNYQADGYGSYEADGADRDKRLIKPDAKFGIKNAVLGLVFGKINSFIDSKTKLIDQLDKTNIAKNKAHGIEAPSNAGLEGLTHLNKLSYPSYGVPVSTTPAGPTTTDDTPIFDRSRVQLEIPNELFGSSFTLVTEISKIVGDVITGTAERTQRLLNTMRPYVGKVLSWKGVHVQTPPNSTSTTNSLK